VSGSGTPVADKKHILLNAFNMNSVGHIAHGLWTHPRDRSEDYRRLGYWTELARTLERGKFDGLFLADIVGVNDVFGQSPEAALQESVQVPINDPLLLIPAMAAVTQHLGFGVTSNVSYERPYLFARRMSTLDHLTEGRVGWNIVTGYLDSAARAHGLTEQIRHDERYDMADDYMDLVYKLWEGSWEDDAVVRDRAGRVFTQPGKVHRILHDGPFHKLDAIHLSEPSPQRTPVLFQAGGSERGREFAATHAECVFINAPTSELNAFISADIRARAVRHGRRADDIKVFAGAIVVVGATEREAREKYEDYRRYASPQAGLTHFSASTGIDLSTYGLDDPIRYAPTQAMVSAVESITQRSPDKVWTVRKLLALMELGSRTTSIVGSPEQVADELQARVAQSGIDGFNLMRTVTPESYVDFVDRVVPVLQDRGVYKRDYAEGSLRHKLFGEGAKLPTRHAGAARRYDAATAEEAAA
jgi:FMN-dependent oxidoreductase (nitrilotriacetate monooxygenase family)